METTDWKFYFSTLPRWDIRNSIPYVHDAFLEIPQSDMLCCIYSIAEVSMGCYLGSLAILKNKEQPSLFLNIAEEYNFFSGISVNTKGNLLFLYPCIYDKGHVKMPILILDIQKSIFSYFYTGNANPCYTVVEVKENLFKIKADPYQKKQDKKLKALSRKKIRLNRLKWHDLTELPALPDLLNR